MKIETDGLQIGDVAGTKFRLVPLVVRGPERRKVTRAMSAGSEVKVTLVGEMNADGQISLTKAAMLPPTSGTPEDGTTLLLDGRPVLTINANRIKRIERRSGLERRR